MWKNLFFLIIASLFSCCINLHSEDFWEKVLDKPEYFINDIAIDKDGIIYVALSVDGYHDCSNSLLRSTDNGLTWTRHNIDTSTICIHSLAINKDGDIFAGTHYYGVFRSTDKGLHWQRYKNGFRKWSCVTSIAVNPNDYIIAITPGTIFRSTDNGDNWREVYTFQFGWLVMNNMVINKLGTIFAGINDNNLYRSTDDGFSWIKVTNKLDDNDSVNISSISIDENDELYISTRENLYYSSNNGDDWINISNGLESWYIKSIYPMDNGNIYVAWHYDDYITIVKYWNNEIRRWYDVSSGISGPSSVLKIKAIKDGYLLLATDSCLYRSRYPITSISENNTQAQHFIIEPNVISSTVNIKFQITKPLHILIRIFDILGNEISKIVDDYYIPGNFSISYDASSLSDGMYFVNFMSENESRTVKIIVRK